jgi:cell division protein FtsQ
MTGRVPPSRAGAPRSPGARPVPRSASSRSGGSGGRGSGATAARSAGRAPAAPTPARGTARPTPAAGTALRGAVSSSSAERFAARVRRRRQRRLMIAGGATVVGLLIGWLLFASTALAVQRIEVRGVHRVSPDVVRAAVQFEIGRSMALIDPQAAAERVLREPLVQHAEVVRSWPSTLVVEVTEREPIAAVPAGAGRVSLVDGDGVVVESRAGAPAGLPLLDVDVAKAGPGALRAARAVVTALPPAVSAMVRKTGATSPDAVTLVLTDGSTVLWGSAEDGARKADALLAVHPRPLRKPARIDVSAPGTLAVTNGTPS